MFSSVIFALKKGERKSVAPALSLTSMPEVSLSLKCLKMSFLCFFHIANIIILF